MLYGWQAFKKRKKYHYLKILKKGFSYQTKKSNLPSSSKKEQSFEESHESFMRKLDEDNKTSLWQWMMFVSVGLLCLLGLANYVNITIFDSSHRQFILLSLMALTVLDGLCLL